MNPEQLELEIAWFDAQGAAASTIVANDPEPRERLRAEGRRDAYRVMANRLRRALADARTS